MKMKEVKCQEEQEVIKWGEKVNLTGRTELGINLMMGEDTRNYQGSSCKREIRSKTGKVSAGRASDPGNEVVKSDCELKGKDIFLFLFLYKTRT